MLAQLTNHPGTSLQSVSPNLDFISTMPRKAATATSGNAASSKNAGNVAGSTATKSPARRNTRGLVLLFCSYNE